MKEWQNSQLILHFWNENIKRVFFDHRQKISTEKSKQTSLFCKFATWMNQVLSIWLLFKFIDQWAPNFLFLQAQGAPKNFS